jgi:predicted transcriptional regulator
MANITLKLEDELLAKVRRLAFERNTSVNAIVTEKLKEFVATTQKKKGVLAGLESFYKRTKAVVGTIDWSRNDLHER